MIACPPSCALDPDVSETKLVLLPRVVKQNRCPAKKGIFPHERASAMPLQWCEMHDLVHNAICHG